MNFIDIENFLVERIERRLDEDKSQSPNDFQTRFKQAYGPLRNLDVNLNYSLPLTGEAYALKYHLARMDSLCVALDKVNAKHPILTSQANRVLDVGGGTGASTMAVLRWLNLNPRQAVVHLCEPSQPMREVADDLVPDFARQLGNQQVKFHDLDLNAIAQHCQTSNSNFDLIIFCYTFWIQEENEWPQTMKWVQQVARSLEDDGVLLFLSPKNPSAKVDFMRALSLHLGDQGWTKLPVISPSGFRPGTDKTCVQELPSSQQYEGYDAKYPEQVRRLLSRVQGIEVTGDNRPYYAFHATIEAFIR